MLPDHLVGLGATTEREVQGSISGSGEVQIVFFLFFCMFSGDGKYWEMNRDGW